MQESIPKAYKPWLILSLAVLMISFLLLACTVMASFYYFSDKTPLWVVLLGVLAVIGIVLGFAALVAMMGVAGYRSFKEERRVQVLPPEQ